MCRSDSPDVGWIGFGDPVGQHGAMTRARVLAVVVTALVLAGCGSPSSDVQPAASSTTSDRTAYNIEFRPVLDATLVGSGPCVAETGPPPSEVTLCADDTVGSSAGLKYRLGPVALSGSDVASMTAIEDMSSAVIQVQLTERGKVEFADLTGQLMNNQAPQDMLAIVVDGKVQSAPSVRARIEGGRLELTGFETLAAAESALSLITAG
jgi:preprotein translocase subunit SecD